MFAREKVITGASAIILEYSRNIFLPFKLLSSFNEAEINAVMKYIKMLLPPRARRKSLKEISQSDIGVVTPYRKQCKKIARECYRHHFDEVTVGTAEVFQGQEKPVMIVSTVRSDGKNLGFVSQERVFIYGLRK